MATSMPGRRHEGRARHGRRRVCSSLLHGATSGRLRQVPVEDRPVAPLPTLTALRFVAALAVLLFHLELFAEGNLRGLLTAVFSQGFMGVTFFFILSCFVLGWTARPGDGANHFYRRRVARVYPAMLVALLAAVVLQHFCFHQRVGTGVLLLHVLALQAWSPDVHGVVFALNPVAWTLSCEAFFYALFPLLWPRIAHLDRARWRRAVMVVGAAGVAVGVVAQLVGRQEGPFGSQDGFPYWVTTLFPPARLPEFVMGMLLAAGVQAGHAPALSARRVLGAGAALLVASTALHEQQLTRAVLFVPLAATIVLATQADLRSPGRAPHWLVALGTWSYALYLIHYLTLLVLLRYVGYLTGASGVALCVTAAVVATSAAGVLYTVLEHPAERALRPLSR